MDCQAGLIAAAVKDKSFTERGASLVAAARRGRMMIIHIQVGFRSGLPEASSRNPLMAAIKNSPERQQLFQGKSGAIHPSFAPESNEVVITKHRVSAFTGTELDMILRAHDIETLVMFGISTSGVVLSTCLDAFDRDYRVVVVKDLCADRDEALHACLTERFFPNRGTVMIASEVESTLGA